MSEANRSSRAGQSSASLLTVSSGSSIAGSAQLGINLDSEVARLVLETGLASPQELAHCREQQKQASDANQRSLADLLVENSFVTATQVRRIKGQLDTSDSNQIPGYQLICKVGKGAMATVYKARQASLDRIVAIKVLPKRMSENAEFVDRFYKEGRAAARLSHNNIVQAIDVGSSPKGYHYFVMEYIEGKTLYDMMVPPPHGDGHKFSEAEGLDIIIQIADALAHSHERGLIHRDVKPKNIIMTPGGVAKLTDMGLARAQDDKEAAESEAGKAYGTPYYISPEQIRGDVDIDHRADIYSLGATLYHLLTRRPPFEADTPAAVMHKHLKSPLIPPDHLNTALSAGVGEIIEVAMAKRREDRYSSVADMAADMRAVMTGGQPDFARRTATTDELAQLEATGKTVDIAPPPPPPPSVWAQPVLWVISGIGAVSIIANVVMLVLLLQPKPRTAIPESSTPAPGPSAASPVVAPAAPAPAPTAPPVSGKVDDEPASGQPAETEAKPQPAARSSVVAPVAPTSPSPAAVSPSPKETPAEPKPAAKAVESKPPAAQSAAPEAKPATPEAKPADATPAPAAQKPAEPAAPPADGAVPPPTEAGAVPPPTVNAPTENKAPAKGKKKKKPAPAPAPNPS